jgi:hypothetical protein
VGSRGGVGQVKLGWGPLACCGDSEAERRLGAATRGGVLVREGVGGNIGELQELSGGGER